MKITRVTSQGKLSLVEFYTGEAKRLREEGDRRFPECLEFMANLLQHLSASVDGPPVYAVTSCYKLLLVSGDDDSLPALVSVDANMGGAFIKIAYKLPEAEAPWKDTWVVGYAANTTQAAEMILIGLRRNTHANQMDA